MKLKYDKLPEHLRGPVEQYIERGYYPGSGLVLVFSHDLWAVIAVDDETAKAMPELIRWIHNEAPRMCHGDREKVSHWMDVRGREGLRKAREAA